MSNSTGERGSASDAIGLGSIATIPGRFISSGWWPSSRRSISAGRDRGSGGTGGSGTAGGARAGESDLRIGDTDLAKGEIDLGTGEAALDPAEDFRMDTGDMALADWGPGGGGSARLGDGA